MSNNVTWAGHEFGIFNHSGQWSTVSGVYIFTGINAQNQWVPLYIGQASSFSERLPNHERWSEAQQLGATHVHAMVVSRQDDRDRIEQHLIQAYQPQLNTHLRSFSLAGGLLGK